MGGDTVTLFLEVLPQLPPGVLVHVHDVFLPYDYPADWAPRYYGEQYLLACYLLAGWAKLTVMMPTWYAAQTPTLAGIVEPLWAALPVTGLATAGMGFWMRTAQGFGGIARPSVARPPGPRQAPDERPDAWTSGENPE